MDKIYRASSFHRNTCTKRRYFLSFTVCSNSTKNVLKAKLYYIGTRRIAWNRNLDEQTKSFITDDLNEKWYSALKDIAMPFVRY